MAIGYETIGNGAHKVVVLHGWFGDQTFMAPMREALSVDEFTYVLPAYRGYGASKAETGAHTIEEISADVRALIDRLGFAKVSLVGHSMGGKFIQKIAVDAPERIARMVAVTPVPAASVPFDEQGWGLFSGAAESLGNRRAILDFTTGSRLSGAWLDHMAAASWGNCTKAAFAAYLLAWAKTDFHEAVIGSEIPIKVIVGEHDGAITAEAMKATFLTWHKHAELEVMANSGHYPMNETPVALATSMEAFLRG
ncbi:MAG TPA: alpha/beta hydrolase [Roseiarcus sp.]|nr:alpha/beta hydrolase [Roseiarcus sp.]